MLQALKARDLERPEVEVLHGMRLGTGLANLAKLVLARDPYVRPAPGWIHDLKKDQMINMTASISTASLNAAASGIGPNVETWQKENIWWLAIADSLALGAPQLQMRDVLSKADRGLVAKLRELADWNGKEWPAPRTGLIDLRPPIKPEGAEKKEESLEAVTDSEHTFAMTMIGLRWDHILTTGFLTTNVPDDSQGVLRKERARVLRAQRLASLYVRLVASFRVAPLRGLARLAQIPSVRSRLTLEWTAIGETLLRHLDAVGSEATHPWIAAVDALGAPGRAQTPWAASSPLRGVADYYYDELTNGLPSRTGDPASLLRKGAERAKEYEQMMTMLRSLPDAPIDAAATVLGYGSGGQRPRLGVYGQELSVVHIDGLASSEKISNPLELFMRPTFPVQRLASTPWIGQRRVVELVDDTIGAAKLGAKVYVEPANLYQAAGDYAMERLAARFIAPASTWQGEPTALRLKLTGEALATAVGLSIVQLRDLVIRQGDWGSIFRAQVGAREVDPSQLSVDEWPQAVLFYKDTKETEGYISERTRKPWRNPVDVAPSLMVTELAALQVGLVVKEERVEAAYIVDWDVPQAPFELSDLVSAFADRLAQ